MFCQDCPKKETCKEICKELENYLRTTKSDKELLNIDRLYSDNHIRKKEVPHDPTLFEQFLPMEAIKRLKGQERRTEEYDE